MVEVTVEGIRRCCHSGQPVLLMKEKSGGYLFPLRLPSEDAQVLVAELTGGQTRESSTYALLIAVLEHLKGKITAVVLHLASNGLLEACLRLEGEWGHRQLTSHPIDALALALRQGCPLFLNAEAVETMGFPTRRSPEHSDQDEGTKQGVLSTSDRGDLPPAVRDFLSTLDLSGLPNGAEGAGK